MSNDSESLVLFDAKLEKCETSMKPINSNWRQHSFSFSMLSQKQHGVVCVRILKHVLVKQTKSSFCHKLSAFLLQHSPWLNFFSKEPSFRHVHGLHIAAQQQGTRRLLAWLNLSLHRKAGIDCKEQRAAICKELGQHFSTRHPPHQPLPFLSSLPTH